VKVSISKCCWRWKNRRRCHKLFTLRVADSISKITQYNMSSKATFIWFRLQFLCVARSSSNLEEGHRWTAGQRAVLDDVLLGQILGRFDRRPHPLDGEERSEVRRVRGDEDEREEPPHAADQSRRHGARRHLRPCTASSSYYICHENNVKTILYT